MPVERVFMSGHAQLPQGVATRSMFETLGVVVEFEAKYGVILRATATLATDVGRDYISQLLIGRSLNDGLDEVIQSVRVGYHGASQSALIAALRDLARTYQAWKAQRG